MVAVSSIGGVWIDMVVQVKISPSKNIRLYTLPWARLYRGERKLKTLSQYAIITYHSEISNLFHLYLSRKKQNDDSTMFIYMLHQETTLYLNC